jgi:hypothetical protein
VEWAAQWSKEQIAAGRANDRMVKDTDYGGTGAKSAPQQRPEKTRSGGFWGFVSRWFIF